MSAHVHLGPWINWTHGLIGGATITLSERAGGLLTAFIATFVTIVGSELWKIICYLLHQFRSKATPQDGLYHQQQVILRNSPTPGGAAWLFLRQTWAWAGKARLAVLRTIPWSIFSILYIIAIGLVAIFSSEISKSPGPQRLFISPDACGLWAMNSSSPDKMSAYQAKTTNDSIVAAAYAKACYGGAYDPLQCGRLPVAALKYDVNPNATCPFQAGVCIYGNTAAYGMTTKMLDSHTDLGINARAKNRIQVEKSTTCAPLHRAQFATLVNATEENELGFVGDQVILYNYGYSLNVDGSPPDNYTYAYNTHSYADAIGYGLKAYQAIANGKLTGGSYVPVPAINTTTADLSILFISANTISYDTPIDDPVFSAHYLISGNYSGVSVHAYNADQWVSPVACSEQYRVCNPNNNVCTSRMGFGQLSTAAIANTDGLELNAAQNATWGRLNTALQLSSVYYATYSRGPAALRAGEIVADLSSGYLPPTQWHTEVSAWFDAGLARIQQKVQEYATGPSNIPSGSFVQHPNPENPADAPWLKFCYSQVVNDSNNTMSFSILGLALLLGIGGIIIMTSLAIDTIVGYLQVWTGKGLHARMEWMVGEKLQMQRLLLREMKIGQWNENVADKTPTTTGRDQAFLGVADRQLNESAEMHRMDGEDDGSGVHFISEHHQSKGY